MSIDTGYGVLRHVLTEYKPKGWAAEFGVYSGTSLEIISERMPVIGFDSFEGLPEDWRPGFPKGKFTTGGAPRGMLIPMHSMVVPGWFEDTVPTFPFPPLGLVHIDCDIYRSTVTALEGVRQSIGVGTFVVFDEYHGYPGHEEHEMKAWLEFCTDYGIEARKISDGPEEAAFVIVKGSN